MLRALLLGVIAAALVACEGEPPASPPPPEVVVAQASERPYVPTMVHVGRLIAEDDVEIRAQVSANVRARHFEEGERVEAGQLLYELDDSQYRAELDQAQALVARQQAAAEVARRNLARGEELAPQGYIAAAELDELRGNAASAAAALEEARAALDAARVNLAYTRIVAPIAGRAGRSEASVGDLVGPNSEPLTTLVSVDPIKAEFQINEAMLLAVQRRAREPGGLPPIRVELELANGERYERAGAIEFLANRVDQGTGTIAVRASMPNPDDLLRPGQYVRVHLLLPEQRRLMVPQAAVQSDQQGTYVLAVIDGTAQRRNVVLGPRSDGQVIVEEGLNAGEAVVVAGLQRVRPDQPVRTRTATGSELVGGNPAAPAPAAPAGS